MSPQGSLMHIHKTAKVTKIMILMRVLITSRNAFKETLCGRRGESAFATASFHPVAGGGAAARRGSNVLAYNTGGTVVRSNSTTYLTRSRSGTALVRNGCLAANNNDDRAVGPGNHLSVYDAYHNPQVRKRIIHFEKQMELFGHRLNKFSMSKSLRLML